MILAGRSQAAPYPIEINIEDDADINQLFFDGEIDEDHRDALLSLFFTKLDLNLATREELYELPAITYELADRILAERSKQGTFKSVGDLDRVDGLTNAILSQISPFISVGVEVDEKKYQGDVRLGAITAFGVPHNVKDDPSAYLRTRVRFLGHGGVGFLFAARPMVGGINDARNGWICKSTDKQKCIDTGKEIRQGDVLTTSPEALRFDPSNFYAYWDGPRVSIIGGTYKLGFGLGLTLDNSGKRLPHGWVPNVDFGEDVDSGKVKPYEGFVGLAARYKEIHLRKGWLDITAMGSFWSRDLYVTDVYYDRCSPEWGSFDPSKDSATVKGSNGRYGCTSTYRLPALCNEEPYWNPTTGRWEYQNLHCNYATLPGVMRELMGGGNITYWINRRSFVGFTGYAANLEMTPQARFIRPNNSAKYPSNRSTFGVWGLNTRFGFGRYDFAAEVAVNDRGAPAALAKAWIRPALDLEIVPSFRYYSPKYDNPYNRGEADGDEYMGNRGRDELGGKLQVFYRPFTMLRLRAEVDVWYHQYQALSAQERDSPSFDSNEYTDFDRGDFELFWSREVNAVDLDASLRIQLTPTTKEKITVYGNYHDEDLSKSGPYWSYDRYWSSTLGHLSGGAKASWALSASTTRVPRLRIAAMFRQIWEDTYRYDDRMDHSYYAWLKVTSYLYPGPRITLRFLYFDEHTVDDPNRYIYHHTDADRKGRISSCDYESGMKSRLTSGVDCTTQQCYDNVLPGGCRGETFIDLYLQITQSIPWSLIPGSYLRLRAGWTHWLDNRPKWSQGYTCNNDPSRDEIQAKGYIMIKF